VPARRLAVACARDTVALFTSTLLVAVLIAVIDCARVAFAAPLRCFVRQFFAVRL
jgi:hypothetical protein